MAFETILEFGEGNRYKVKFEVANIDTSTVDDVELDEEIASLEKVSETDYAFNVREYYSAEGEHEVDVWEDDYRGGDYNGGSLFRENRGSWSCDYSVDRFWSIGLDNGELLVGNDGDYEEMEFDNERFPEGLDVYDVKDDFETDAKYDVLITYEKLEDEGKKANSITLDCHNLDIDSNYGTGIDIPDVELSDADLEKLAEWYVKHYGNGLITVEDVKNRECDDAIKEVIEQAILDNVTVYDEKARKYYNQTVRSYYVNYSAKVNCSFELNGMNFNINYDEIERDFPFTRGLEDYSDVLELVEKDELDNLFSDSDKDELERLKVDIKDNYYSVASLPVEVDWELCKGFAKETGVSDEYLTEANLNRALELALEDIASEYTNVGDCFVLIKDNLIHVGTNIAEYEDTAEEDIETIGKLTLEEDELGILRLYVSGEMQDDLSKASDYKEVITRTWSYVTWFKQEKVKADTYIQEINAKIKNILPSLMERILNLSEVDKNKEWIVKKLGLAKELEEAVKTYLSAKREVRHALENDSLKRLNVDTTASELLDLDISTRASLRAGVGFLTTVLGDLQVGKSSFSMLQVAEIKFEEALKMESGTGSLVLREIRSSLEKLLSEHSDNEKMAQEIEEALALTKQPKVITAEEEMVSAWNKYIGLKMEGQE
jgi:hypothetical protein